MWNETDGIINEKNNELFISVFSYSFQFLTLAHYEMMNVQAAVGSSNESVCCSSHRAVAIITLDTKLLNKY